MPKNYLSEIEREDGTVLTIKDAEARAALDGMDPTLQQILQGVNDIKSSIGDVGEIVEEVLVGPPTLIEKTITENGTYDASDDEADGYSSVTVDVSGGGGNATFATATEFNYVNDYLSLLTNIDIPDGVESIGDSAFSYCVSLTSITIPNSVTTIESSVFMSCSSLTSITFEPTTPPTLSVGLGIPTTCIIRVPQGTLSAYTSAENYPDPSEYIYEEY